jgi:hypothetical protein
VTGGLSGNFLRNVDSDTWNLSSDWKSFASAAQLEEGSIKLGKVCYSGALKLN